MDLSLYLFRGISILIAITLHEYAHSFAAYKLGDSTSSNSGRMSFNPLDHIDPVGAICMIVFGFGWAKPVMIEPRNFKNPKIGMGLTTLAGPLMNLILGFIGYVLAIKIGGNFFTVFTYMNVGLFVFNLLPIPPLDGAKVWGMLLPDDLYFGFMQYERYGFMILFVLIMLGAFSGILSTLMFAVINLFGMIVG